MSAVSVTISYGDDASDTHEGRVALEMTVNILARLLPAIAIWAEGAGATKYAEQLGIIARAINPGIGLIGGTDPAQITIHVGLGGPASANTTIYIGSDGWRALLSGTAPRGCGSSEMPFGAAAAACIGCANVFRSIFRDELPDGALDAAVDLSLANYDRRAPALAPSFDLGENFLAGVGAIGNGLVWTLARTKGVKGTLHLIDGELADLGNLQRYVLTNSSSEGVRKVDLAAEALKESELKAVPHFQTWGAYLAERGNHELERVVVALDTASHRIAVQGSLPRRLINAWTQQHNLGISRHNAFLEQPCLACLYLPDGLVSDEDDMVAAALNMSDNLMAVRMLLHSGAPLPADFINDTERRSNLPAGTLAVFVGQPLRVFYTKAVCGGLILNSPGNVADVPMPFQSALAGVMLAAEMIHGGNGMPATTSINLLRPIPEHLSFPRLKHPRCFCADPVFARRYSEKWLRSG